VYFSGVPKNNWPPAVDARPPAQPEESSIGISSESGSMDVGRTESPPLVSAKIQGKRPAADEPAKKKRKTAATAPRKLGGISLGDDQTNRTRRTTMFDLSDDEEILTDPPPSMKEPPRSPCVGEQPRVGKEVYEAPMRKVLEQRVEGISAQQTTEVPMGRATSRSRPGAAGRTEVDRGRVKNSPAEHGS